jgi:hypothetical protein
MSPLTLVDLAQVPVRASNEILMPLLPLQIPHTALQRTLRPLESKRLNCALVVRSETLRYECLWARTLEVSDWYPRCIDGKLLIVCAKTVTVGVGVGEEAGLQDRIGSRLEVRDDV